MLKSDRISYMLCYSLLNEQEMVFFNKANCRFAQNTSEAMPIFRFLSFVVLTVKKMDIHKSFDTVIHFIKNEKYVIFHFQSIFRWNEIENSPSTK